jgi:hypothetical protein
MANELTPEQQQLAQVVQAVAGHCDGAQAKDFQGFNGVDTHFGRRIALVDPTEWTPEVWDEVAHIMLKYREQGIKYTGIDVAKLQIVLDAQDQGTNYAARNQARRYEKLAEALKDRKIDVVDAQAGLLGIFYGKKDPDFKALLPACQALPGRKFDWNLKCNVVPVSDALEAFILEWDFPLTDAAKALLQAPRAVKYEVTLEGRLIILDTPYNPAFVDAVRSLPGRSWDGSRKVNTATPTPQVLALADRFSLKVHPDARAACDQAAQALKARESDALVAADVATVINHVSSAKSPEDLPEVFVQMFKGLGR